MLSQTIWRRFLFTGGSGRDSTTTAAALAGALAGTFADGVAVFAGGAATAELSGFTLLSTLRTSANVIAITLLIAHTSTPRVCDNYTITRDTGIDVSVKTNSPCSLEVQSQLKNNKMLRQKRLYTSFAAEFARE